MGGTLTLVDVRTGRLVLAPKSSIPHLRRQAILQVQQTRLAHALDLRAGRAHLGLFESAACSRVPPEDSEGPVADLAFVAELLLALRVSEVPDRREGIPDVPCGRRGWDRGLIVSLWQFGDTTTAHKSRTYCQRCSIQLHTARWTILSTARRGERLTEWGNLSSQLRLSAYQLGSYMLIRVSENSR